MKNLIVLLLTTFLLSCSNNSKKNWDTEIFELLQKLEADQISVNIEADAQTVVDKKEKFTANLSLEADSCQITFENTKGEIIKLQLKGANWHKQPNKRIHFKEGISVPGAITGSFLIQKRKDLTLKDGWIEIRQMNQEACIITLHGSVSNGNLEESAKPISGLIVWKKPQKLDLNAPYKDLYF